MSMRATRLAAILLPAALVLHEGAYAVAGGGLLGGSHGYLELAVPFIAALAASLAIAAILLPAFGVGTGEAHSWAPFAVAGALASIFCVQELAEAVLLGGGWSGFAASVAVAWLVPPLALLLGALASALILSLERAADLLAVLIAGRRRERLAADDRAWRPSPEPFVPARACAGLAFGSACRPPPRLG